VAQPEGGGSGGGGQGGQQQPQGCQQMGGMLIPILIMFAIIYFLMIRPQQKQQKKHKAMIGALKKGDKVITNSGIFGTVTGMTEAVLTIEVAKNVHIRVLRGQVAGLQPDTLGKESEAQPVVPDDKK
jgi:preprotein translocase subunit YajC